MGDVYDFSFAPPTVDQLVTVGAVGVIGYVSNDPAKNITVEQIAGFHAAGLTVGFVHENTASWRTWDGATANRMLDVLGVPADVTLYYAADEDVPPADFGNVHRALWGQPSVRPRGIYGGKGLVATCLAGGSAVHGWGTAATSWDHGTCDTLVLQQHSDSTIGGTDRNQVLGEWGGWSAVPSQPLGEETMLMLRRESDGFVILLAGGKIIHVTSPADEWQLGAAGVKLVDHLSDAQFQAISDAHT